MGEVCGIARIHETEVGVFGHEVQRKGITPPISNDQNTDFPFA